MKTELLRFWPDDNDVNACVKSEAEASSEAVSLAVHQPMRFDRRMIGGASTTEQCTEHDLLNAFLTSDLPEGRVILPIVGLSGSGKSHVVRWLDAQIKNQPGADGRVVIRIPKGTSLRGVLSILLDRVEGPNYDNYRRELVRAQQELDPKEAAGLLCEMLAHTLTEMAEQAQSKLTENPADRDAQECVAFCRPQMLPSLLRNQHLRDNHFLRRPDGSEGVAKRLVEQLTEAREAGAEDDRQHLFQPADLDFSAVDRDVLGRAEQNALNLLREDRRPTAARILNAALDAAKQRLLRLDPTISELFDEIRRELLKEGKELVLLVEDFVILSGLQKQLLQIVIKEAIRDGRQVLCTMRTALAYTTGYLDTATVLTRANVEFQIPNEPGTEEEILARISRLVGAYLNAARHGQAQLEREYEIHTSDKWVPAFRPNVEPDVQATVDAFGISEDGYPLFPFNHAAVVELAREGCIHDGRLVYNPRYVIQNVITKVLRHRRLFEQSAFPPSIFGTRGVAARVAEDVRKRVPPGELDRYLRFVAYWGGFPTNAADIAAIAERTFTAFDLNGVLLRGKSAKSPAPATPPRPLPEQPKPQTAVPWQTPQATDPLAAHWEQLLERWRAGTALPQADANVLRKWIADALKGAVEWNWVLHRPLDELSKRDEWSSHWFTYIFIPNAGGNEGRDPSEAMLSVCTKEDLAEETRSARIFSMLMSIVRFHGVHKGASWGYEAADDDLPQYCAFLDRHVAKARTFIRDRYFRAEWDAIPTLANALLIGARALGVEGADKDADEPLIAAIFHSIAQDQTPAPDDETGWRQHRTYLSKCRCTGEKETRDHLSWTTHLLSLVGARQGRGDTVHAIDVVPLKAALEQTRSAWTLTGSLPSPSGVPEFAPIKALHADLKRTATAVTKARDQIVAWRKAMVDWLGEYPFDKDALVREMKAIVDAAKTAGLARDIETKPLIRAIEAFRMAGVVTALDDAARLDSKDDRGTVLTILGRANETTARACDEIRQRYDEFVSSVNAEVESQGKLHGEDPQVEALTQLQAELSALENAITEVSK